MTDEEKIQKYAEEHGYPYIKPLIDIPGFSEFYVALTQIMKDHPKGKFGQPFIITLDQTTGNPFRLTRDQFTELCRRIKESSAYQSHIHG